MKWTSLIVLLFLYLLTKDVFAGQRDTYSFTWLDPDKEVYVLQNRKYRKVNSPYLNLGGGFTASGAFIDASHIQTRAGFFFYEEWGLEFLYSRNFGSENITAASVRNHGGAGSIPFRRNTDNYMAFLLQWSPFYSKINTFNQIIYVDWMLGLGIAKLEESNNREEFMRTFALPKLREEIHDSLLWQVAMQFYLSQNFSMRLDLVGNHYQAQKPTSNSGPKDLSYYRNIDVCLSFGMRL